MHLSRRISVLQYLFSNSDRERDFGLRSVLLCGDLFTSRENDTVILMSSARSTGGNAPLLEAKAMQLLSKEEIII